MVTNRKLTKTSSLVLFGDQCSVVLATGDHDKRSGPDLHRWLGCYGNDGLEGGPADALVECGHSGREGREPGC